MDDVDPRAKRLITAAGACALIGLGLFLWGVIGEVTVGFQGGILLNIVAIALALVAHRVSNPRE